MKRRPFLIALEAPGGFEKVDVDGEKGLNPEGLARAAMIWAEGGDGVFRIDGGSPAEGGHAIKATDRMILQGYGVIERFRVVPAPESGDLVLQVTYFY